MLRESALAQLDLVLSLFKSLDLSQDSAEERRRLAEFKCAVVSTIDRVAGQDSVYGKQAHDHVEKFDPWSMNIAPFMAGIISNLRADVEHGLVASVRELAHAEIFADFLEMADHLANEGYKDPAAVMAGGALESHLRQLCVKHGIDVERETDRTVVPKKADLLNSDLAKADVYEKLDQKSVTAWLDLRNKAAHAEYDGYTNDQVALMIQAIRDFLTRNAA